MKYLDEDVIHLLLNAAGKLGTDPRSEGRFLNVVALIPMSINVIDDDTIFSVLPNQILDDRFDLAIMYKSVEPPANIEPILEMASWDEIIDCILNNLPAKKPSTVQRGPIMAMNMN